MRFIVFSLVLLGGCTQVGSPDALTKVQTELEAVKVGLAVSSSELASLKAQENAGQSAISERLDALQTSVGDLAADVEQQRKLQQACQRPPAQAQRCEASEPTIIVAGDDNKMLLGEVERVWIDPPGLHVVARMDTGASSSSLDASNITPFERDGEDWVRFEITGENGEETSAISVERPVVKFVRVFQQADREGSRRPVVALRLRLGDVQDTFEFTLADRSHLEHGMILGRNFLTDMALVDVSRQFVQPAFVPAEQ